MPRCKPPPTCDAAWREAVGEKLAADTRPGNVRRGVLEVLVRNLVGRFRNWAF